MPDFQLSKNSSRANVGYYVHKEKKLSLDSSDIQLVVDENQQSNRSLISKSYENDTIWRYETHEPEIVKKHYKDLKYKAKALAANEKNIFKKRYSNQRVLAMESTIGGDTNPNATAERFKNQIELFGTPSPSEFTK